MPRSHIRAALTAKDAIPIARPDNITATVALLQLAQQSERGLKADAFIMPTAPLFAPRALRPCVAGNRDTAPDLTATTTAWLASVEGA